MLPAAGQMTNMILLFTQNTEHRNENLPVRFACAIIIITYIALNSVREVLQLYQQRWHYLLDPINLVSWLLYISSIIMIVPVFVNQLNELQHSCASITVFLSWFNLLLYLQRWVSLLRIFLLLKNKNINVSRLPKSIIKIELVEFNTCTTKGQFLESLALTWAKKNAKYWYVYLAKSEESNQTRCQYFLAL